MKCVKNNIKFTVDNMILTIKGADFSGAGIGANNSIRVQLTKTSGVSGSITQNNFEKNQVISTATVIANLALLSDYENLTVTVTMGGTSVNAWYSNGVVTIPSNTTITGDIKISASATAVSGGGDVVEPEPEEPGTGGGSGETQYYTLTHGNDYNKSFMDAKTRACIQPYTITVPSGVTITPKTGYLWAWYNNVNVDEMPIGNQGPSGWVSDTYTGKGTNIGIAFKKEDDSEIDFSIDSIYASDYFDVSDYSIWIVDNSTPSEPSEPSEPSGENSDLSTITLQFGNSFGTTAQASDPARANSTTNVYLSEGTTISLKDNNNYKWALKKVTSETGNAVDASFNSGNYVPDAQWSTKKSYTITKSGYYRIVLLKSDNSAFDWSTDSNKLGDYFTIS